MSELPESRSVSTRFRILVEIASRQPSVQQRDVARELGISVQAVSERMKELLSAGLMTSRGRASYAVTPSGVDWLLRTARELESYSERISRLVRTIWGTAAIADTTLSEGQRVTLQMMDGMLHARPWQAGDPATGVAACHAKPSQDVAVVHIEGVIPLTATEVVIATIPSVQDGGSRCTDTPRLRRLAAASRFVSARGIEPIVALNLAGIKDFGRWASPAAVIEAASAGVQCLLVCTAPEASRVSTHLSEAGLQFSIIDLTLHPHNIG